jgi:hypothetical protein
MRLSFMDDESIDRDAEELLPGTDKGKGKARDRGSSATRDQRKRKHSDEVEASPSSKRSTKVVACPSNVVSGHQTRSRTKIT